MKTYVAALLLLVCLVLCQQNQALNAPATPKFADNYKVRGLLSLPYAKLNEPFSAWYDKQADKSRTDYFGDVYQVFQIGSKSDQGKPYGELRKTVWVPKTFKGPHESPLSAGLHWASDKLHNAVDRLQRKHHSKTPIWRTCFEVKGAVGSTISAQSVLPDLSSYKYDSSGKCPHHNEEFRHKTCELWKLQTGMGDKKNTYKFWLARQDGSDEPVPVHFYMLGYDSLLGSHYDRYDISYFDYQPNGAQASDFDTPEQRQCRSMPGPGDSSSPAARRSHIVANNPIHEFVSEPHKYEHIDHEFDQFAEKHSKEYQSDLEQRKGWLNFLHNFRFINSKNRELKEYKLKVNHFADNNLDELGYLRGRLRSTGYNGGLDYEAHHKLRGSSGNLNLSAPLPESWDWTTKGAVTPVKDQAVCGSCWSFGTAGTLEGAYFVKTGKLPVLSQQQMVDCSWKYGNNGCDGGEDFRAYQYIMDAGGLSTEKHYGHYKGIDAKCHDQDVPKTVKISGFYNVTKLDPEALKHALINYGPVTVAIDASRPTFTFYSHGLYSDEKCNTSPDGLDHQVLVVGYEQLEGKLAWKVKNSWSTYWGDQGYIMMSAENNICGLMDMPTVPIIDV